MKKNKFLKRILSTIIVLLICMPIISNENEPVEIMVDSITYELNLSDHKAILTDGSKAKGDIVIPGQVTYNGESFTVSEIKYCAFYSGNIRSIYIPGSVKKIGTEAFASCYKLKKATLCDGIEEIGTATFRSCKEVENVYLSKDITEIPRQCFLYCDCLSHINIPDNLLYIKELAFAECRNLVSVNLPNTLREIGDMAFTSTGLEYINIPPCVEVFGGGVITCTKIKHLDLSNTKISRLSSSHALWHSQLPAFTDCPHLKTIKLPPNIKSLPSNCFEYCKSLEEIDIPENVDSIDSDCFYECKSLKKIKWPSKMKYIGYQPFSYCPIEELILPEGLKSIPDLGYDIRYLIKIEFPSTTESIQDLRFYPYSYQGDESTIICKAETPPTIEIKNKDPRPNLTLYVPRHSMEAYKNHKDWWFVGNIKPIEKDPTSIEVYENDGAETSMNNGIISITGLKDIKDIQLYDINGKMIKNINVINGSVTFDTKEQKGKCVIMRYGKKSMKVKL